MLLIRNFEIRGEAAYQQGKVGGFYHSYMGQEAIQTGCIAAAGPNTGAPRPIDAMPWRFFWRNSQ